MTTNPIGKKLKLLINNKEKADVKFLVGKKQEVIYGHKLILSLSSQVWETLFYSEKQFEETVKGKFAKVLVEDLEPDVFKILLEYAYTSTATLADKLIWKVIYASDKFGLDDLKDFCQSYLIENLNEENCLQLIDSALKCPFTISPNVEKDPILNRIFQFFQKKSSKILSKGNCFNELDEKTLVFLLNSPHIRFPETELYYRLLERGRFLCNQKEIMPTETNKHKEISKFLKLLKLELFSLSLLKELKNSNYFDPEQIRNVIEKINAKKMYNKNSIGGKTIENGNLKQKENNTQRTNQEFREDKKETETEMEMEKENGKEKETEKETGNEKRKNKELITGTQEKLKSRKSNNIEDLKILILTPNDSTEEHREKVPSDLMKTVKSTGITDVDYFNLMNGLPTFEDLKKYDAILVFFTDYHLPDTKAIGDLLAKYAKDGGGIVVGGFTALLNDQDFCLKGKLIDENFVPMENNDEIIGTPVHLGEKCIERHPVLNNVKSYDGGNFSWHINVKEVTTGSQLIAKYDDDTIFVASKKKCPSYGTVVVLNMFPISDGITYSGNFFLTDFDGRTLIANALEFVAYD
ncbi:btb/poz domain-containing [Anaeramoeba flamelloides]|uniref:Btb/poz domain-containing n=1 Tax=Anaeramoeba flamelloides TaxID=1746091 RepID=A0ABQ8X5Y6_9EUKA|nr:btb/poz domain-containing [Anaeramoeba flamelloides]